MSSVTGSRRAAPMAPDERRASLVAATVPLLREHGLQVSTRQIAEAAGVAEGTIFRVFESKDELVQAALRSAFEPGPLLDRLVAVDTSRPLRDRLVEVVRVTQERFVEIFSLMAAVGMIEPPDHHGHEGHQGHHHQHCEQCEHGEPPWRRRMLEVMAAIIEPDREQLRVPPEELVRLLRLLTFSGSHSQIADGRRLTPEEIVDVLLYGTCATGRGIPPSTTDRGEH